MNTLQLLKTAESELEIKTAQAAWAALAIAADAGLEACEDRGWKTEGMVAADLATIEKLDAKFVALGKIAQAAHNLAAKRIGFSEFKRIVRENS